LYALGNYIRQTVGHLCGSAQLRYRLQVEDLPRHIQVSSQTRHNLILAVKESVHNAVKHAKASEVTVKVALAEMTLGITIQDNGCGFEPAAMAAGNGLANMKRRLQDLGGTCVVASQPGQGTTVQLRLTLPLAPPDSLPGRGPGQNDGEMPENES
jgi:signal transduction histidine kinase